MMATATQVTSTFSRRNSSLPGATRDRRIDASGMHTGSTGLSGCGDVFERINVEDGDVSASVKFYNAGGGERGKTSA